MIQYWHQPCYMESNNCTMSYYDYDWNWQSDNCTNNLSDVYEWNTMIQYAPAWYNESHAEAAHIYSFWMDWHALHDGDWYDMLDDDEFNYTDAASIDSDDAWHWAQNDTLYRDIDNNPWCETDG